MSGMLKVGDQLCVVRSSLPVASDSKGQQADEVGIRKFATGQVVSLRLALLAGVGSEWLEEDGLTRRWWKGLKKRVLMSRSVAVKYVRRREDRPEVENWKQILLEIRALLHEPIRYHPNIVRLLGFSWGGSLGTRSTFPALILEYAEFGSLADLQKSAPNPFAFHVKKKLCHDVAKGLAILHACGIVHGDLKHDNVLVFRNKGRGAGAVAYTAKLADFGGSAMDIQAAADRFLPSGTPPFEAPEARHGLDGEGLKCTDVYSLGLLVWRVILDGENPFGTSPLSDHTPAQIEDLKRFDVLLPIARDSVRDYLVPNATDDELDIVNFALDNTLQALAEYRSLKKVTAALQVNDDIGASPSAHGANAISMGLLLAKVDNEHDYDYQNAGPGSNPRLPHPDPAQFLFDPERLKPLLDWSLQADIVRDLESAAAAVSSTSTTQVPKGFASFYLFRSYVYEFGVELNAERACYWLRQTAFSPHECQENYLAQAWCWRIHRALGQPLNVELAVLRQWLMLAIFRGHRRCISDAQEIISSLADPVEKRTWENALAFHTYYFLRVNAGVGMPYFVHRKLRRVYNLDDMAAFDRDVQAEFVLRGVTSVDQIYVNHRGDGILHLAAAMGNLPALQHIVKTYHPNIDLENQVKSETPLLAACRGGHLDCALFLLENGARPDGSDEMGEETPLYWLCSFSPHDAAIIARKLVDAGALLAQHGKKRQARLHTPSVWADPENLFSLPVSPLSRAVIMQSISAVEVLLSLGADPLEGLDSQAGHSTFNSTCPVVIAAVLTLPRILEILLSCVDATTPLLSPAEMLQGVFQKSISPAVDPTSLQSRLSRCGSEYKSAMFETLQILHSWHLNILPESGFRPAHPVVARMVSLAKIDVVESLLELGYSVHGTPQACPIVEAVKLNHEPLFRLLVAHGADIHTTITREGGSKLSLLQVLADKPPQSNRDIVIADYLIKMGVSVDPSPDSTRSAFAFAVKNQDFALAELLVKHGADVNFAYRLDPQCAWITVQGELLRNPTEKNLESIKYLFDTGTRPVPFQKSVPQCGETSPSRAVPSFIADITNNISVFHFAAIFAPATNPESLILGKMLAYILAERTCHNSDTVNQVHPDLGTPLWAAALCCNIAVVMALLEHGADPNIEFMGLTAREVVLLEFERTRTEIGLDPTVRGDALRRWIVLFDYFRVSLGGQTELAQ
ncbi:serine/threonine protein kinase japonica group [Mycena pura]|uniref:Serine/threonine protein kinase japonica group n=1 Tax=Mycena pura TaxID=153505 RepID=A0AAD6YDI5_9AGAR|nr:serine/threonine protein kinase japonica group [Mycena pura]